MNRREPGYLIPEQRRLEHVWSISCRNLVVPEPTAGQQLLPAPDVYFTLSTEGSEGAPHTPLYRSELALHTVNPAWVPMEWSYLPQAQAAQAMGLAAKAELLRAAVMRLRIYARWTREPGGGMDVPLYFPPADQLPSSDATSIKDTLVFDRCFDLRDLWFLGFDLTEALAQLDLAAAASEKGERGGRGKGGGGGGDAGTRDASADLPPDAAGYQLDSLPVNTLVLWLDDGHYTLPDQGRALQRQQQQEKGRGFPQQQQQQSQQQQQYAAFSSGGGPPAKYDLRRGCDAVNRLMQLRRDTLAARAAGAAASEEVAAALSSPSLVTMASADSELVALATRVAKLRAQRDALAAQATDTEVEVASLRHDVTSRASSLRSATGTLSRASSDLTALQSAGACARSQLSLVHTLLAAKRLSLLSELRQLYPIAEIEPGRRYTIRGISLPDRDLTSLPEEQVSTALGYTCHLTSLLSKYLGVPLRYRPGHMASRSTMRDEAVAAGREFPLYWKGLGSGGQDEFSVGLLMLRRDVAQLLHSQGLAAPSNGHMLGHLGRLFSALLDLPLPPAPPPAMPTPSAGAVVAAGGAASATATQRKPTAAAAASAPSQ